MTLAYRTAASAVLALVLVPISAPATTDASRSLRQVFLEEGRVRGVDASPLLERAITIFDRATTIGAVLDAFDARTEGLTGPAGTTETQVGDIEHFAFSFGGPEVGHVYTVTTSAVVPATPGAGAPIPGTPATGPQAFVDYGGALVQITGAAWNIGAHVAGGPLTSVDTAESTDPVTISGRSPAILIGDRSIDFTGHVGLLANSRECIFGVFCYAIGGFAGDGIAFYDQDLVAGVAPRPATPTIP
jgi:hypothetical protein